MKKIYLNFYAPSIHSMYKKMVAHPPEWYSYILKGNEWDKSQKVSQGLISKTYDINKISWFWKFNKKILSKVINTVQIKDILYPLFVIPKTGIDLIYSTGYIVKRPKSPWILDMEILHVLNGYNMKELKKNKSYYKKHLESDKCWAIVVWNSNIYNSLQSFFDSEVIESKTHIIRHTIIPSGYVKDVFSEKSLRFLFLGSGNILTASYIRGIKDALIIYRELTRKHKDISLTIAPFLPKELEKEFWSLPGLQSVERLLKQEEMQDLYKASDILLHPSYSHPAMTLVEAMNYGLAILTTSYAGIDDLVQDGYNGIICKNNSLFEYFDPYHMVRHDLSDQVMLHSGNDPRMIQDFVEKAEMLMRDPELRKSLAQNAQKTLEQGEYSFQQNNEKRKNIYDRLTWEAQNLAKRNRD